LDTCVATSLVTDPSNARAYAVSNCGRVLVIDGATRTALTSFLIGSSRFGPFALAVHPTGPRYYLGGNWIDGSSPGFQPLHFGEFSIATNAKLRELAIDGGATTIAASVDGRSLYALGPNSSRISVLDFATYTIVERLPLLSPSGIFNQRIVPHPHGTRLYVATPAEPPRTTSGALLQVVDLATRSTRTLPVVPSSFGAMGLSPGGRYLYVATPDGNGSRVVVIDTASDTVLKSFPLVSGSVRGLAVLDN
jgi:DNA-binding beta-propeller fold protein YncE